MEKMNNTTDFDANVDRFLRHQMTCDEEGHFKAELLADPDKKERARIIALMVKSMRQEGLKQDQAIVDKIYNMDENQFRGAAHLKGRSLNKKCCTVNNTKNNSENYCICRYAI